MDSTIVAAAIREHKTRMAERAVALQYEAQPYLQEKYGAEGRNRSVRDAAYHFDYLAQSIEARDQAIFVNYLQWLRSLLRQRNMGDDVVEVGLDMTERALRETLDDPAGTVAAQAVQEARSAMGGDTTLQSVIEADGELAALALAYLEALLVGDRRLATRLIMEAVDGGTSIREIYLDVFQKTQREIGRLWQLNRVSVAQEHFSTAATQMIMSQLYPRIFSSDRIGRRFVGTCVGGELHEIGIRMVADFFEMEGWDTYYLGANAPLEAVVETVERQRPDILGISATMTFHVSEVSDMIEQVRAAPAGVDTRILVGGYPFNVLPGLWKNVGADGYAADAMETISTAEHLLA